jgi:beta-glucosidase
MMAGLTRRAAAAGTQVVDGGDGSDVAAAVAAASRANVSILFLTGEEEGESHDREQIALPAAQAQLLTTVLAAAAGPVVVVTVSGGAVSVDPAVFPALAGLVASHRGGMQAGSAMADVLWGDVPFSGRLASTVYAPQWVNASAFLDMGLRSRGHRYLTPQQRASVVLFPFGFGLGYSQVSARWAAPVPATLSVASLQAGLTVNVSVELTNTGARAVNQSVILVLQRVSPAPAEQWPVQWLPANGFARAPAAVPANGGVASVTLSLCGADFRRWIGGRFQIVPGAYTLAILDTAGSPSAPTPVQLA